MVRLAAALITAAVIIGVAATVLWLLVVVGVVSGICYLGRWLWREHCARVDELGHRRAEIAARAEL